MSHLATPLGIRKDKEFQEAYWKTFESFFGDQNARVVKATLLAKVKKGDTGDDDLDRICYGLRQTMGWVAEAIEKRALRDTGHN